MPNQSIRELVSREPGRVDQAKLLENIREFHVKLEAFLVRDHRDPKTALTIAQHFIQLLGFIPDDILADKSVHHKTSCSGPFNHLSRIASSCVTAFAEFATAPQITDPVRAANVRTFLSALQDSELRTAAKRIPLFVRGIKVLNYLQQSFKSSNECCNLQAVIERSSYAQAAPLVGDVWFGVAAKYPLGVVHKRLKKPLLPAPKLFAEVVFPRRDQRPA
jgi:hypothetical protein